MCDEKIQKLIENLSDDELEIMFHTLGYNFTTKSNDESYGNRNNYYTSEDTRDGKIIKDLIDKGCMYLSQKSPWKTVGNYYSCTALGKDIVIEIWRRNKKADKFRRKLKKAQGILAKLKTAEDELLMEIRKICAFEIDSVLYQEADGFVAEVEDKSHVSDNYSISDIINQYIRLQRKITIENLLGLPF